MCQAADWCESKRCLKVYCLRQVAVNRSRLKAVVEALLRDMPHQREAAARREEGIEFARQFHNVGLPLPIPCAALHWTSLLA